MKQVEVAILGQVYKLGCPEGGDALLATAVAAVDQEMSFIRDAGKVRARERIAVLAALNLAYQLAERGAQPSAASNPGATSPVVLSPGAATSTLDTNSQKRIENLLQRIDDALSEDGQLL